jgi:hypothetical protein
MARLAALCLVVLVLPGPVVAAPGEPALPPALKALAELDGKQEEILRGMLASEDARTVAWGAYEAARRGGETLVPALLRLATDKTTAGGTALDEHALRSVHAALVDLNAKAPAKILRQLLDEGGFAADDALILAVRRGSDEDLLMVWDALGQEYAPSLGQIALGNALAHREARGFAARLLAALEVRLRIEVRDDRRQGRYCEPRGSVPGDGRFVVPPGYPPTVLHSISDASFDGSVVLADGIHPIYLSRTEYRETEVGFGDAGGMLSWQDAYREFLAMLLREDSVVRILPRDVTATHRWKDSEHYVAWAAKQWNETHERFWALVARLVEREVLTEAEAATLDPRIEVLVKDERSKRDYIERLDLKPPPSPYRQ